MAVVADGRDRPADRRHSSSAPPQRGQIPSGGMAEMSQAAHQAWRSSPAAHPSQNGWVAGPGRLDFIVRDPPHVTGLFTIDSLLAAAHLANHSYEEAIRSAHASLRANRHHARPVARER